jgi:TPR repeat protein
MRSFHDDYVGQVLGYLHYDGEGVKTDLAEACQMFKLAAACGSKEGEQVLGW